MENFCEAELINVINELLENYEWHTDAIASVPFITFLLC